MIAHFWKFLNDEEAFKRTLPASIRNDATKYEQQRSLAKYVCRETFPEDVCKRLGSDPQNYVSWIRENIEWLRPSGEDRDVPQICIDEDVKSLGLSNRKVELLDVCVSMLGRGDQPERALRILNLYTCEHFTDAISWRSWLDAQREGLFFTEAGGYKFMAAPQGLTPPRRHGHLPVGAHISPTARIPVVAEAVLSPARVHRGERFTLVVRVETAPSWHIAARNAMGPEMPTRLSLVLPGGIKPSGDWVYPEPSTGTDGRLSYAGMCEFRCELSVDAAMAAGPATVACTLNCQACNMFVCKEPSEIITRVELLVE